MPDPYAILGVKRDATNDEVKRAFRRLAKTHHPDRNANDPKAKERFSEISAAYDILGDEAKRKAYDRGEIDHEGKPRHPGFDGGGFAGGSGPGGFRFDFGGGAPFGRGQAAGGDPHDIFSDLFRKFEQGPADVPPRGGAQPRRGGPPPGEDVMIDLAIALEDVARGGNARVTLPGGRVVEVKIPQGVASGTTMRLKGQGHPSPFGARAGDALLTLNYARHPRFTLDGADLRVAVLVSLRDAVLGGSVRVPTLDGEVEVSVPAWTSGGKTLRLRGKGLPLKERKGDLLVSLDLDLGVHDPELEGYFRRKKT